MVLIEDKIIQEHELYDSIHHMVWNIQSHSITMQEKVKGIEKGIELWTITIDEFVGHVNSLGAEEQVSDKNEKVFEDVLGDTLVGDKSTYDPICIGNSGAFGSLMAQHKMKE